MDSKKDFRSFQDFTNLYELSKTLRFELRPVKFNEKGEIEWINQEEMEQVFKEIWDKDLQIHKNYKEAKKWFDKMHREFINESLLKTSISTEKLQAAENLYWSYKNDRKANDKKFKDLKKELREGIIEGFNVTANLWRENYTKTVENEKELKNINKDKNKGINFFFKDDVFNFLSKKYPEALLENKDVFNCFNKFSTYFSKFHKTRGNFYEANGTSTAIPTRIIDINLPFFLENKRKFEKFGEVLKRILPAEILKIFNLSHFNLCFNQNQINEYNVAIGLVNSAVNKSELAKQVKFKILYKQILGEDGEQESFVEIKNDEEVFPVINDFIKEAEEKNEKIKALLFDFYKDQMNGEGRYDISRIYFSKPSLNTISNRWFSRWDLVRNSLLESMGKKKTNKEIPDFISLLSLKDALSQATDSAGLKNIFRDSYREHLDMAKTAFDNFLRIYQLEFDQIFSGQDDDAGYDNNLAKLREMMGKESKYSNKKEKNEKGEEIFIQNQIIKKYADSTLAIYRMAKYFAIEKGGKPVEGYDDLDENFYDEAYYGYSQDNNIFKYYNALRDYLTKKGYKRDKVKINFDKGTLMGGWSADEKGGLQYCTAILKDDEKYFLAILKTGSAFNDKQEGISDFSGGEISLMEYEQLKSQTIFGTSYAGKYGSKWADDKLKLDGKELVKRAKEILSEYTEIYPEVKGLLAIETEDAKEFIKELNELVLYKLSFKKISKKYLADNIVNKFYLFEIYNKDFSPTKIDGSKENIHTFYFKNIFTSPKIKLSGGGEIFFRKASEQSTGERLDSKGKLVKKYRRYLSDKFFLHVPIILNNGAGKKYFKDFNAGLKGFLKDNKEVNIIGIDRGERNLAYYSVINQNGEILEQGSFNKITANGKEFDYFAKLDEMEKKRDKARKSWQEIEKIKEIKDGYISHVVYKLYELMLKHNAIIVFENLNAGFKRGRFKIEKQVYQKLELALATKLNYLALKDKKPEEQGGALNAYQLTPKVDNFSDMEMSKQFGAIFYIPASFTSAVCPVCGFRKSFSLPIGTKEKNKELVEKFDINYDAAKDRFSFSCLKSSFFKDKEDKKTGEDEGFKVFSKIAVKDDMEFYSDVDRVEYEKSADGRKIVDKDIRPTEMIKALFGAVIDIDKDISTQIKESDLPAKFYEDLLKAINAILKIRNTKKEKDENGVTIKDDYLQCPACHFDTRNTDDLAALKNRYKGKKEFSFDGDANGAYNIARKGAIILEKINKYQGKLIDMSNSDLTVYQEEWDKYLQGNK